MRIPLAITAALVSVAALGVGAPATADTMRVVTAQAAPAPVKVLFVGDSVMKAFGLDISQSWPVLIGQTNNWSVTNLASNGSGYVTRGENDNDFLDVVNGAAAETPDVVVLEGSSNDFGVDNNELAAATNTTFAAVRQTFPNAEIIGLSTIWGAEAIPAQLVDTDTQVQAAVAAVGGQYLDIGQPFHGNYSLMQGDDVHPTADGQAALGDDISPLILQAIVENQAAKALAAANARIEAQVAAGPPSHVARLAVIAKLSRLATLD